MLNWVPASIGIVELRANSTTASIGTKPASEAVSEQFRVKMTNFGLTLSDLEQFWRHLEEIFKRSKAGCTPAAQNSVRACPAA